MRVGSLCTGYGGIELGLTLAGESLDLRWLAEFDAALDVLHPAGVPNLGDITTVDWSAVEPVDLLTAGFPCQPVSAAGNQLAEADPRWLWPEVHRAVAALLPPRVLLENVRNLVSMRKGEIWAYILNDLAALGYDVTWLTLGACAVGAAHHRHRVFALATNVRLSPDGWLGPRSARRLDVEECGARRGAAVLPSPAATNYGSNQGGAAGRVGPVRHSLDSMARLDLLPTPAARDGDGRGEGSAEFWAARRPRRGSKESPPLGAVVALLPSPTARDGSSGPGHTASAEGSPDLRTTVTLLPSPRATDGVNGGPGQRGSSGDLALPSATQPQNWGRFEAAVARHASIFGLPPAPTEPNRNGSPRLAPAFAEWLMCIPAGHVTDALPRAVALKAIGNGVCPPQLAQAWRYLTGVDKPSDISIGSGVMTTSTTSQDVKEIQDRQSAGRGAVIAAAERAHDAAIGDDRSDDRIAAAIEAAMMALVEHWRAEADIWEAGKKRGSVGTAKEIRAAASRLAGFAVGLTTRPVTNAERIGAMAQTWDDALSATCGHPAIVLSTRKDGSTFCAQCQTVVTLDETFTETDVAEIASALPADDPVRAAFATYLDAPVGIGSMFPGEPGYREAEHGRPQAPCYECLELGEDPLPWCECDGPGACKGPCRMEAHPFHAHPQGCTHYSRSPAKHANRATCPYCGERLPLDSVVNLINDTHPPQCPCGRPECAALGLADAAMADAKLLIDPVLLFTNDQTPEQNLRDIIGPLGANSVTATIDHPFTSPSVPWLNRRPVATLAYPQLAEIATATAGTRDHVSHSYVESYENCSLSALLRDASRFGQVGAQRPGWSQIGGSAFHSAVEAVERAYLAGVVMTEAEAIWNASFDAAVKTRLDELVGTPYADSATWYVSNRGKEGFDWWRVEGARMLKMYLDKHTPAWREANQVFRVADTTPVIEYPYEMTLRSLDGERGLTAQGFIDMARLNMTTYSLTVIDYKTGARDPESTFQLGEYGHALLMAMGIPAEPQDRPILGQYWLARKGIYTDAVPVLQRHPLDELQYRYDAAMRGTTAKIFSPHTSNLCKSCSSVDYCPTQAGRG